jgi:hypothetical protein
MAEKEQSKRSINTQGGAYVEGGVTTGGGDFVGRDQNKVVVQGNVEGSTLVVGSDNQVTGTQNAASLTDLVRLVDEIRAQLPQSGLDPDTQEVVEGDFRVVENQLAKPEPKKALILPKLKSIAEVLTVGAVAGEAVQKLAPMVQQAIAWAQQVLR